MHDILIALVFVSLVASPAIVAAFPQRDDEEVPDGLTEGFAANAVTTSSQSSHCA